MRTKFFCSMTAVALMLAFSTATSVAADSPGVLTFGDKPAYQYLAFEKGSAVTDGVVHLVGRSGQGGAGFNVDLDLRRFADHTPAIWLKAGPDNEAKSIKLLLFCGDTRRMFDYSLDGVGRDSFERVFPEGGLPVAPPDGGDDSDGFDAAKVTQVQIQGNWLNERVDVLVERVEWIVPDRRILAMRQRHAEQRARRARREREAEAERLAAVDRLLTGAPHPQDGPRVTHVGAATPQIIEIRIESGSIRLRPQVPLRSGAEVRIEDAKGASRVLAIENGEIGRVPRGREVFARKAGSNSPNRLGDLVVNADRVAPGFALRGTPLSTQTVTIPKAYEVVSSDDPAFLNGRHPDEVFIKTQPKGPAQGQSATESTVYLSFDSPLMVGARYTIRFVGVNTAIAEIDFEHAPRTNRSESIHVSQIGFRPSDPFKRAYLSLWKGTGGATGFDRESFELIDAESGRTVYSGTVLPGFSRDRKEALAGEKNHTRTDVAYLDFHDFDRPGRYVVHVPGIGISFPFEIGDRVWEAALKTSMHGFLSHRSGIELGSPFTEFERPRPMHPDDGFTVYQLDVTFWNGEVDAVARSFDRLLGADLDAAKLTAVPAAWGGYMDAGDWDRRSQHLTATWLHLELLDMFPDYFANLSLALPPDEAEDAIPDLLNEALWNINCYRRLQRDDGGVGGGIESTEHPRPGEASWQESLLVGAFAPDPETSYRYAACAARASRLLEDVSPDRSRELRDSALRAWQWGETEGEAVLVAETRDPQSRRGADEAGLRQSTAAMRALASVALYRLTEQSSFHDAFRASTVLTDDRGDPGDQVSATFAYATLPESRADHDLRAKAREWFVEAADRALWFSQRNSFNLANRNRYLPVIGYVAYFSVPGTVIGGVLPRAHHLTGDAKYLRGAVAATQFAAGANPMNLTLTTGLGHRYPEFPLHVDHQHAGIEPPRGITVYGPCDLTLPEAKPDWVERWYLGPTMIPASNDWPTTEAYIDLGNWPSMTEYTVHQTFGPTSFYWAYLAARR